MKIPVAIVEDNNDIRNALEQVVQLGENMQLVGSFARGEEALQQIPHIKPRVVLMDINLGSSNGIDLVKALKAGHPEILFMMCTVYEEDQKIFDALRAGASGYILKKSSPLKIIEAIKELNEGGAPMSSLIARKVVAAFHTKDNEADEHTVDELSKRENEILEMLAKGKIYKEIAGIFGISAETVRKHVYHIYEKLHVTNRVEAVNKYFGR